MNTKKTFIAVFAVVALALVAVPTTKASAQTNYYYVPTITQYQTNQSVYGTPMNQAQLVSYLQQLIIQLQAQLATKNTNYYQNTGSLGTKYTYVVGEPRGSSSSKNNNNKYYDDEPEVRTDTANSISRNEARLRGTVDMNDFEDGEVFFVYGTNERAVEDVEDDYTSYRDVDTDGSRLQKVRVNSSLDGYESYNYRLTNLSRDTNYYFQLCVGFEDDYGDDTLICGGVEEFTTNY